MRIKVNGDYGKIKDPDEFQRQVSIALSDIVDAINGNIEFDLNVKSKTIDVTFRVADVEVEVAHGLGRKPIGYVQAGSNVATSIYNTSDPDTTNVYLKSSQVAIVQVVIF